jgi:hypothetical protein
MGMDPLSKEEEYELTVVLKGPVKKVGYRNFRAEFDKFIDECEKKCSGFEEDDGSGGGTRKQIKLKVRETRGGVRKAPPASA